MKFLIIFFSFSFSFSYKKLNSYFFLSKKDIIIYFVYIKLIYVKTCEL